MAKCCFKSSQGKSCSVTHLQKQRHKTRDGRDYFLQSENASSLLSLLSSSSSSSWSQPTQKHKLDFLCFQTWWRWGSFIKKEDRRNEKSFKSCFISLGWKQLKELDLRIFYFEILKIYDIVSRGSEARRFWWHLH